MIYSLELVELENLKTYIKINLAIGFIKPFKSLVSTTILFIKKPNSSFWLCVNYQDLNNLTIKNRYPLFLIGKSLNWLGWITRFTQLDLTSAYH